MTRSVYRGSIACCLLLGALTAVLNVVFSHQGFDNYDLGPMVDAGWRVYSGQVPGRDFVVTFPPSHYLLTALFFRIFGVTWAALSVGSSCFFGLMTLLGLRMAALVRKAHGEDAAVWVAVAFTAGQAIFLLPYSVVWHATLAMDFAMYGVSAVYALAGGGSAWVRREAMAHLTLALACLLLSKANTAYPAIVLCLVVAAMCGVRKRALMLMAAVAVMLASAALGAAHTSLFTMLAGYRGLAGRMMPIGFLYAILYYRNKLIAVANLLVYAMVVPLLWATLAKTRFEVWKRPAGVLGLGSILIALVGMGTNIQFKLSDTPLMLLGCVLLASDRLMMNRAKIAVLALTVTAVCFGGTRLAFVAGSDWNARGCRQLVLHDAFLGEMMGCEVMQTTLSEVDRALGENPQARVFFGPGLEFLYAGRRGASPLGMPNWWHPGTSYPLAKASQISEDWKRDRFDVLIFNATEYREQMPAEIGKAIDAGYVRVVGTNAIHVYKVRR
jgi:hypothetical protein